ncbi:MAG TPA: PorP/SprF family type IX secretion system membrane protein [Chitinophagaceae bacterium]|nr:PorP/SprF family type IX secretion system membrane protein [Chitinophagaceae bacterium]
MKISLRISVFVVSLIFAGSLYAQDPSFSQFFSSPLNVNPALTANINADWRLISNFRDQWIGPASPYVTGTISYDSKILQKKIPNVETEGNIMGLGGMLMFDHAMAGIVKSTYASLNMSYSIKISETDSYTERIGLGFGAIYGNRTIDFNRLTFEEQFTGFGFNTNLPAGETSLSNMKPYFSASAGIIYNAKTLKSNFDLGVAGFHLNKPKQTFLEDENQFLAIRKVAHANFETFISERAVLNTNAIYQFQDEANYFSIGAALGYYVGNSIETMITAGLWYWSKNALIPYVGLTYKDFQFGISYDITTSKLNDAARRPKSWEVSIILRGVKKPSAVIPCPWK